MSTGIQWTEETWNPTTGCDRISPGCDNCYALTMAKRLKGMGQAKYQTDGNPLTSGPGFGLAVHRDALDIPRHWRKPRTVFVNSMSDLGHARIPREFLAEVWQVMAGTPQHTYQVLTKRPERITAWLGRCRVSPGGWITHNGTNPHACGGTGIIVGHPYEPEHVVYGRRGGNRRVIPASGGWPLPNVWLGTSIESARYIRRADDLRATPAAVRFLSLEPLLGPLPSLSFEGIDWAIIGGESGGGARPLDLGWIRELVARGHDSGTAMFVKQLGSVWAQGRSKDSHGGDWDGWPADLRIREYPHRAEASAA